MQISDDPKQSNVGREGRLEARLALPTVQALDQRHLLHTDVTAPGGNQLCKEEKGQNGAYRSFGCHKLKSSSIVDENMSRRFKEESFHPSTFSLDYCSCHP